MRCNFRIAAESGGAAGDGSGEEEAHQGDDDDDSGRAVFHQHDETFIGLLMGRIIVAISGRVGHFVMLCHRYPQSKFEIWRRNTAKWLGGQRRARPYWLLID